MTVLLEAELFDFKSENLHLKPVSDKDLALYVALYTSERVMRFIAPALTEAEAVASFANALKFNVTPTGNRLFLTVTPKGSVEPVALCCIAKLDRIKMTVEIGNMVLPSAQGKRLAQEATRVLMNRVQEVLAITDFVMDISEQNLPAIRAAKLFGFCKVSERSYIYSIVKCI